MAPRRIVTAIAAFALLQGGALAQTCDQSIQGPIVLPVGNVTVSGGKLRRGMQFQYGTPVQNLAVAVSQGWNETYIYGTDGYCDSISSEQCTIGRGGPFDKSSSSTWTGLGDVSILNSDDKVKDQTGSDGNAGEDLLTINSTLSYDNFRIAVPGQSGPDYSSFGLGKTSRILERAYKNGSIASHSWSLFWGQTGLDSQHAHDGAVVLGGVDETQITGKNFTGTISCTGLCRSCMIVQVTDMVVSLPDGTSGSLFSNGVQGQGVNYCLETEFPMITMLEDYFYEWESLDPSAETTGNSPDRAGGGPNVWGLIYPKENVTKADLKITIGGSLDITIPNHQLVQAYYTFDSSGDYVVNDTMSELMINQLQAGNANDIPKFGMTFFQAAYLHVNYETNEFTLWEAANPTGTESRFAGVGTASAVGCGSESNSTSPDNNSTAPGTTKPSSGSDSGISGGAIGGAVAGAVVGTAAIAALVFFLWQRKNKQRKGPPSETATPLNDYHDTRPEKPELMGSYTDGKASGYFSGKSELESQPHISPAWMTPQEVPANSVHRPTMEPQELPSHRYD